MNRKLLYLALGVVGLLAGLVAADLIINITVVPLVLTDVIELSITREVSNDLRAVLTYEMKTDTGAVHKQSSHDFILTPAQRTVVLGFLNDSAIPAANVAENLVP